MIKTSKYDFSFTASSLRLNEMLLVARAYHEGVEVDYTNDLGGGKSSTGKRMLSEFKKRISHLTPLQIEVLLNSDLVTQNGKNGQIDHHFPVQIDHRFRCKLTT